jgi:serine/threonine-protein kinase
VRLEAIPREKPDNLALTAPFDGSLLFERAGLDYADFTETEPVMVPPVPCTVLRAWKSRGDDDLAETTVQAGVFGGKVTYFDILERWDLPDEGSSARVAGYGAQTSQVLLVVTAVVPALFLARRNLKKGRSDRKGAFRVALFILVVMLCTWCLEIQLGTVDFGGLLGDLTFGRPLGHALVHAAVFWLLYVAMEPYVRRLWPEMLVSWTRLLMGRFRDPLLGRDILIGAVLGAMWWLQDWLRIGILTLVGASPPMPAMESYLKQTPWDLRESFALLFRALQASVYTVLIGVILLLLFRLILRRTWAAAMGFTVVCGMAFAQANYGYDLPSSAVVSGNMVATNVIASVVPTMLYTSILAFLLLRFGLAAVITTVFFGMSMRFGAQTLDMSNWWAGGALVSLGLLVLLVLYAFRICLAGRPLLKERILEE